MCMSSIYKAVVEALQMPQLEGGYGCEWGQCKFGDRFSVVT